MRIDCIDELVDIQAFVVGTDESILSNLLFRNSLFLGVCLGILVLVLTSCVLHLSFMASAMSCFGVDPLDSQIVVLIPLFTLELLNKLLGPIYIAFLLCFFKGYFSP